MSGPEDFTSPPLLLFATAGLSSGTGGIAELSRQVFQCLLVLHHERHIQLRVHVLEGTAPNPEDALFQTPELPEIRWFGGSRWKFALSQICESPRLILFDHVGMARLTSWVPRRLRSPYVVMIHGIEIWKHKRRDYHRAARKAEFLIANSEYTAAKSRACYPDLPKIWVCLPGKDSELSKQQSNNTPVPELGSHAMLIVGRLSAEQRHKGHDHLINAMPMIVDKVPGAKLIVAGEGDDRQRLESKVHSMQLTEHVLFTGWLDQSQLQHLYGSCALFVMPSEGDGFGLVFLEAMMNGLPCVGLRHSAAEEIFVDGKSGILVDREDRLAMANQLVDVLLNSAKRTQLAQAGLQHYLKNFTAVEFQQRLNTLIKKALQSLVALPHTKQ